MPTKREPFPLDWPGGQSRTRPFNRRTSRFKTGDFVLTRSELVREVKLIDGVQRDTIVLSTNLPVRQDGLPKAGQRAPHDPGAAVYFTRWVDPSNEQREYAIACDTYKKIEENIRALIHTVSAMRTIQRHGSGQLLEQAMQGFKALPPPPDSDDWRRIFGFAEGTKPHFDLVKERYRALVHSHHPDRGGDNEKVREFRAALSAAEREYGI